MIRDSDDAIANRAPNLQYMAHSLIKVFDLSGKCKINTNLLLQHKCGHSSNDVGV